MLTYEVVGSVIMVTTLKTGDGSVLDTFSTVREMIAMDDRITFKLTFSFAH